MRWARRYFEDTVKNYDGDECILWPYATVRGYAVLRIEGKLVYVCRLLCPGEPPTEQHNALHSCGRGAAGCVTKNHLYWGTQAQNVADTLRHGTRNRGTRNGCSVLTENEVHEIRRLLRSTRLTQRDIGALFGVTRGAVKDIARGRNWAWLGAREEEAIELINEVEI